MNGFQKGIPVFDDIPDDEETGDLRNLHLSAQEHQFTTLEFNRFINSLC